MFAYIVTIVAVVLAGIFAILMNVWAGFAYFVLATFLLLSLFWAAWLIYKYFTDFKKELNEKYSLFVAERANKLQMTSSELQENESAIKTDFKRHVRKEKFLKWAMIVFCFGVAVVFLMGIVFYQ